MSSRPRVAHPVIWTILYLPFGALSGYVGVALAHEANSHGLSITEGALFTGANLLTSWFKFAWAPLVDVTLTPKRWYTVGTATTALGVVVMSAMPLSQEWLWPILGVIAAVSLVNSVVGMAIEAIMAACTAPEEQGRTSAWFQAGNLGGSALGGFVGLELMQYLPEWAAGVVVGALLLACTLVLPMVPAVGRHAGTVGHALAGLASDLVDLARTRGGLLAAFLCFLPIGTGAAQGVLAQGDVAFHWAANADDVAMVQGLLSLVVTTAGCFGGGWLCDRMHPRTAYAVVGLALAVVAVGMGLTPVYLAPAPDWFPWVGGRAVPVTYYLWNLVYAYGVGLAYAAFTAVVLNSIGSKAGATKYSIYASLSNFPIWWLGLALGRVADTYGASPMLYAEALFAVVAIGLFSAATWVAGRTQLPDTVEELAGQSA